MGVSAPSNVCPDTSNLLSTLDAFMQHCKIIEPPVINHGLFA